MALTLVTGMHAPHTAFTLQLVHARPMGGEALIKRSKAMKDMQECKIATSFPPPPMKGDAAFTVHGEVG